MEKDLDKSIESLKIISEYIGENYFFSKDGIRNLKNNIKNVLKELEKEKEKNKTLIKEIGNREYKVKKADEAQYETWKELETCRNENNNLKLKLAEMYKARGEYDKAKSIMTNELRDIENKDKEIEIKDKMIDLMAERIEQDNEIEFYCNGDFSCSFIDGICKESDEYKENYHISCIECIKEHFRNEVLKDE